MMTGKMDDGAAREDRILWDIDDSGPDSVYTDAELSDSEIESDECWSYLLWKVQANSRL